MKTRNNPFFPAAINELVNALATYWRDMSRIVDGKFDCLRSARWHRVKIEFVGDVEIPGADVETKPESLE